MEPGLPKEAHQQQNRSSDKLMKPDPNDYNFIRQPDKIEGS
jgi:hypothetical protein